MKFTRSFITVVLLPLLFIACEKEKETIVQAKTNETPLPAPTPVEGKWMGVRLGMGKSIPFYFGLHIKSAGQLDVLNKDKQVIGAGTWKFVNNTLTATYTMASSGEIFSMKSNFFQGDKISGTWGFDDSNVNGGYWDMDKIN